MKKTSKLKGQKLIQTRSGKFQAKYLGYRLIIHGAVWKKVSRSCNSGNATLAFG